MWRGLSISAILLLFASGALAQESPYIVTYDHHIEEPGNLEIATSVTTNIPRSGQRFYAAPCWEFEYGVTTRWTSELYLESYRPLGTLASGSECRFCGENFSAGMEFYGGLGSSLNLGLDETAHYAAPVIAWLVSDNATLRFSPGIGLTHDSSPVLFRFSYSYEIKGFRDRLARLFGDRQ